MHVLKGGASDYGSVKGEALREEKGHSKVGTINPELTDQNYSLCEHEAPEQIDEYIKALGVKRKIRADAVRFVSVIIDYPKDELMDEEKFFQNAKEGLKKYFNISEEAILYAQVHKDEGHPHMHLSFVPLIQKEKTYKDGHTEMQTKLSAFDVITQESLQNLHPFMQSYMASMGFMGTIHHDDGEKRDKEFLEHKLEQIEKEIAEKQTINSELTEEKFDLSKDIFEHKLKLSALNGKIAEKSEELDDVEEQIKEKNKVIEPLEAKISLLSSQMDNLQAEADKIVSEAKLKAKSIVDEAQTEALSQKEKYRSAYENILNSARSKADEIVSGAKTEAQGIIDEAQETADAITHAAFSNADLQTVKKENEKLKAENTWLKGVIQTFHDKIEDIYWVHHEEPLFAPLREFLTEFNRTMHYGMDGIKRTVKNISSNLGH